MQTQQISPESLDSQHLAYGREVAELLSQSDPATWVDHLWEVYSGFMIAQQELGFNPRCSDIFESFKELVFFFQKVEAAKG